MNRNVKKVFAVFMALVAATGLLFTGVFIGTASAESTKAEELKKEPGSDTAPSFEALAGKVDDETVYVFTDAEGSVKDMIVSDWIRGNSGDQYREGASGAKPPVDMRVTYSLDGKKIDASDLAGKSGHVTIRYNYTNREKRNVKIDGKEKDVYVPFLMLTGVMLDNDVFKNVEVTNGKLVNDGRRQVVLGYAFPGLKESLDIDAKEIRIPDYFEIDADVTDFKMNMSLTVCSCDAFKKATLDEIDSLDILDSMNKMTDAMGQLKEGAGKLDNGMKELLEGSGSLQSGVRQLSQGAGKLNTGASALYTGASSLSSGADQLSAGLNELATNNDALTGGAEKVFETLLSVAQSQIREKGLEIPALTIGNYSQVLESLILSLDDTGIYNRALSEVTARVDAMGDEVYRTYLNNHAESIYLSYIESLGDSVYKAYLNNNGDSVYQTYLEGISGQLCMQYVESIADTVYQQYADGHAEEILSAYVLSQIPEEQKAEMTEEQVTQAVQVGVEALTEEQKAAVLQNAVQSLTEEEKQSIREGAASALSEEQKSRIIAGAKASLTEEQKAKILQGALERLTEDQKLQIRSGAVRQLTEDQKQQILEGALKAFTGDQKSRIRSGAIDLAMASDEVQAKIAEASGNVKQLAQLKAQLDTYNQFYIGLTTYTSGVAEAAKGAKRLADGAGELKSGAGALSTGMTSLYTGIGKLDSSIPDLVSGITKLSNGSGELADGIKEFDKEAIEKLVDTVEGGLDGLKDRLHGLKDAADQYQYQDVPSGEVEFIYKTDEIEK